MFKIKVLMEDKFYKSKNYKKLGFSAEETEAIVKEMNLLLSNYFIYQNKLRFFRWNIKGRAYYNVIEEYNKSIVNTGENTERIGHRIMILGHIPLSDIHEYIKVAEIKQVSSFGLNASQMVVEILKDFEVLYTKMINVIDKAREINDVGTIDLIDSMVIQLQEERYKYSSWLDYEKFT